MTHLTDLLRDRRIAVLSGAGLSTESGIPDYRGPTSSQRARAPIQYQDFMRSQAARVRYWARSCVGWPRIRTAQPNAGHRALVFMEQHGALHGIITQNVDGLHHAAGSTNVVELHGSLAKVRCMSCGQRHCRDALQQALLERNSAWAEEMQAAVQAAPDGDAEIPDAALRDFAVPDCACGGVLKPDVVFFGENVPAETVDAAWRVFNDADVLLVVGSSLAVYSGRRFVYRAQQQGKPVAVINLGPTRADDIATVKVEGATGVVLPKLARSLAPAASQG